MRTSMLLGLFALPLATALVLSKGNGKGKGNAKGGGGGQGKLKQVILKDGTESCAPPKGELGLPKDAGSILLESGADVPKFFLHEEFVDTTEMLKCFYKAKGAKPGVDEFDFKLMPDTAEHMVDIWMLEQLRKHPSRTKIEKDARFHIVGFPIFNSYAGGRFWNCGSHEERVAEMVTKMTSSKSYLKSQGRNFVVIATAPDAVRVFTDPLITLAKMGGVIVATADKNYPSVEPFKFKVVIPCKSMHPLENDAWKSETLPMAKDRNVSFMFHGDVSKGKRAVLRKVGEGLAASDIQDHDFQHMGMNGFKKVVEMSVSSYKNSKFCLVAEGSTPTSRRLFDAMAGGCVPIMIGGEAGIKRNLPFQKTIDWSKIVYYGGNLDCVGQNYVGTQNFLKTFLELPEAEVDERRMRAFKTFKGALSYKGPGIVDALLRELKSGNLGPQ